ncbi:MAG: hypothetical protein ACRDAT_07690 [Cetobacterium sp.]
MKKILILLSLALTVSAFGAIVGNQEKESEMNITATVIRPLTIKSTDMTFGTIIQGAKADAIGTYTLAGEPGAKVDITADIPEFLSNEVTKTGLPISFKGLSKQKQALTLDGSGNFVIDITGSVNPTTDTVTGDYKGTIVARVQYQ